MSFDPVFDPKTISDEALFTKQNDLNQRRVQAARMGRPDMLSQIDVIIAAIEQERRERMFLDRWQAMPDSPIWLETDPTMREQQVEAEEKTIQQQQPPRPIRRTIRTATPVLPSEGTER